MVTSRASLIRRHFRQRFGISASRVGVRSQVNWYWRLLIWGGVFSVATALAVLIYDAGRRFSGFDSSRSIQEISGLRLEIDRLALEKAQAVELARALDSRLQVETATIDQMKQQIRQSQRENAALRGDLALFEALIASPVESGEVLKVARVRVEPASISGRYRYSVLFVRQVKDRRAKDYVGDLQFSLNVRRSKGDGIITVPGDGNPFSSQFRISVRHFFRAEGEFTLPPDVTLLGGEVRIMQDGVIKVRHPIVQ
jgi:hypothetical protein